MADPILLNPDNRLLGSSTGDLSLYGGQTETGMVLRAATPDAAADDTNSGSLHSLSGVAPSAVAIQPASGVAGDSAVLLADSGAGSALPFGAALQAFAPTLLAQPSGATVTTDAPAAPAGFLPGAGSLQPSAQPVPGAVPAGLDGGAASAPIAGEAGAALAPFAPVDAVPVPALAGVVTTLLESVGDAALPLVTGALDGVADTVTATGQAAGALVETALDGVGATVGALGNLALPVVGDIVGGVGTTLDALGDGAGPVAGPVLDLLGATVDGVGDAAVPLVGGVVDGLGMTLGAVGSGAAGLVGGVADGVANGADAASDTLADLPGSDPLGGVSTLVGLVSVSDLFDLQTVEAPEPEAIAASGFGILDTLTDDLPDALLGGDHDAGLVDHLGDIHHPFGL